MPEIDHNPHEKRQTNGIWWVIWPLILVGWVGYLVLFDFDVTGVALGFLTGGVLASWAIEVTGNKAPDWWR